MQPPTRRFTESGNHRPLGFAIQRGDAMLSRRVVGLLCLGGALWAASLHAQTRSKEICPRPAVGSTISEPADLRSQNGELKVELVIRQSADPNGGTRYCYLDQYGDESPNLRVRPGDRLILTL